MMFTYTEAYRRYTERFTRTEVENGQQVTYTPESVCNHKDLDAIFAEHNTWDAVLNAMREFVGSSVSRKSGR